MKAILIIILILLPFTTMAKIEYLEDDYDSKSTCDEDKRECGDLADFKALDCNEGKIPKFTVFNLELLINTDKKTLLRPVVKEYELMFDRQNISVSTNNVCFGADFSLCINRKTLILKGLNREKPQCKIVDLNELLKRHFERIEKAKAENKF